MRIEELNNAALTFSQLYGNLNDKAADADFEQSLKEAKQAVDRLGEGLNGGTDSLEEMLSGKSEVKSFREKLVSKGAVAFVAEFNAEKIKEKLAAKKAELQKELGLDEQGIIGKSKDETRRLNAVLEQRLEDYKKELLAQSQNNALTEKQQRLAASRSSSSLLGSALNLL
nr:hypothetical protein [uncultured Campylobacter sp.]